MQILVTRNFSKIYIFVCFLLVSIVLTIVVCGNVNNFSKKIFSRNFYFAVSSVENSIEKASDAAGDLLSQGYAGCIFVSKDFYVIAKFSENKNNIKTFCEKNTCKLIEYRVLSLPPKFLKQTKEDSSNKALLLAINEVVVNVLEAHAKQSTVTDAEVVTMLLENKRELSQKMFWSESGQSTELNLLANNIVDEIDQGIDEINSTLSVAPYLERLCIRLVIACGEFSKNL